MIYLKLIWSFIQIGLFSIGGGYAALPLIQAQVVDLHHWLTMTEFADILTISQMTPGPIAINAASFVGIRMAGIPGAIVATFGCVLPCFCIALTMAVFYYKYRTLNTVQIVLSALRPAVVSLIASAAISIVILAFWGTEGFNLDIKSIDFIAVALFAVCLFIMRKWKLNPIIVMIISGIVGGVIYMIV